MLNDTKFVFSVESIDFNFIKSANFGFDFLLLKSENIICRCSTGIFCSDEGKKNIDTTFEVQLECIRIYAQLILKLIKTNILLRGNFTTNMANIKVTNNLYNFKQIGILRRKYSNV